ncbi:MAG: ferredoxin reductase [Candidatus Nanopelagicales bacterium]
MTRILSLAQRLTSPLLPDDYLTLIDPLLAQNSLRGRIVSIESHTTRSSTIVIHTARPVPPFQAGQHIGVGVDLNAVRHWRTFSLSGAAPLRPTQTLHVTVKATGSGGVSDHLVNHAKPGDILFLEPPTGEFTLTEGGAESLLMIAGGSGITPLLSMIRTLTVTDTPPYVHLIYSATTRDDMVALAELRDYANTMPWFKLTLWESAVQGRIDQSALAQIEPDWKDAVAYVCGPAAMLTAVDGWWREARLSDQLKIEQFQTQLVVVDGEGGTATFSASSRTSDAPANEPLLTVGEAAGVLMPSGCRIGICHTCVVPLKSGKVRDLRTGRVHGEPDEPIQTCINAAACDVELDV